MNAIAATETSRKNGRRTFSLSLWRSPHAPPLFFARTNMRWLSMTVT